MANKVENQCSTKVTAKILSSKDLVSNNLKKKKQTNLIKLTAHNTR